MLKEHKDAISTADESNTSDEASQVIVNASPAKNTKKPSEKPKSAQIKEMLETPALTSEVDDKSSTGESLPPGPLNLPKAKLQ